LQKNYEKITAIIIVNRLVKQPSACPVLSRAMKQASLASSSVQGGGKRV
jgi:hypothetical protein